MSQEHLVEAIQQQRKELNKRTVHISPRGIAIVLKFLGFTSISQARQSVDFERVYDRGYLQLQDRKVYEGDTVTQKDKLGANK